MSEYLPFIEERENKQSHLLETIGIEELPRIAAQRIKDRVETRYETAYKITKENYMKNKGHIPEKVLKYVEEKGWMQTKMLTLQADKAKEMLEKFGFEQKAANFPENGVLMIFNLPKHINQFWDKNGAEYIKHNEELVQEQPLNGMAIEWGAFYDDYLIKDPEKQNNRDIVWNVISETTKEFEDTIEVERVNQVGQHTNDYYYLFIVKNSEYITKKVPGYEEEGLYITTITSEEDDLGITSAMEKLKTGTI